MDVRLYFCQMLLSKLIDYSYNEHIRLSERYLKFDVSALKNVVAIATGRAPSDIVTFSKLSEGGFNRVFQATFKDGRCVIARLPYPSTVPEHYTVASEVATLDYLRLHGIRTPEVYASCSTKENPVGSEYIIMEKLGGTPLGDMWYSMTPREQHNMMKQIVEWETRLMSSEFPACGSIYYCKDLPSEKRIPLSSQKDVEFCIGPIAHYSWWHDERSMLNIDGGPCKWMIFGKQSISLSFINCQQGCHLLIYFGRLVSGSCLGRKFTPNLACPMNVSIGKSITFARFRLIPTSEICLIT
jgi:hypothetical protein